jgi:hypothetical protein
MVDDTTRGAKRQRVYTLLDSAGDMLGASWPVSRCLKTPKSADGVPILHNGERARFDVSTCQSPWTCPVCAARITAGRKREIERILTRAAERGWRTLFLTVTLQHHTKSRLAALLKGLTESWRFVFAGDRSGERAPLARVKAQIKTVEVRYGRNGWHPHLHVLLLVDETGLSETEAGIYEDALAEAIFSRYARKAEKLGMVAAREAYNCQPVRVAGAAAHYVSKLDLGIALEVTTGDEKDSRAQSLSYSPFQLLALYERGEERLYGRSLVSLYREYAVATRRKRQMSYSREIKTLLGIEQEPDESFTEQAEEPKEERELARIAVPLWRVICAWRLRADLLNVADSGDEERVRVWLLDLVERIRRKDEAERAARSPDDEPPEWENRDFELEVCPDEEVSLIG